MSSQPDEDRIGTLLDLAREQTDAINRVDARSRNLEAATLKLWAIWDEYIKRISFIIEDKKK